MKKTTRRNLLLAAFACCGLTVASCVKRFHEEFPDEYDRDEGIEAPSPNQKNVATEYTISGGGAAGYVLSRVQIRPANQKFSAAKASDDFIFEIRHASVVGLTWKSDKQLVVTYEKGGDVYRTAPTWDEINISYVMKR